MSREKIAQHIEQISQETFRVPQEDWQSAVDAKLARIAVDLAVERYGADHPHRFGMSDDDPQNVVLAISAMRDCKLRHPDKRFFVINTNRDEFVKLEIFDMDDPVTAARTGRSLLADTPDSRMYA